MQGQVSATLLCLLILLALSMLPPVALLVILMIGLIAMCMPLALKIFASFAGHKLPQSAHAKLTTGKEPFVSIVIACAAEPHAMVNYNLEKLADLNYKNFEVIVIDNNNTDVQNYSAIEQACKALGPKFKFYHLDHVSGFKSGALNLANKYISPKSGILAIVDADYAVSRNFLHDAVGYFDDPKMGIVQAPQDYSNPELSIGLYYDYQAFFSMLMNQAQAADAVTFTGTMGLIRYGLFREKVVRWNEWCITEDTEAGIYIHTIGYKGQYIDKPYGQGLMPFTYHSLLKQRGRWSYGNAQILRRDLFPVFRNPSLTWGQRFSFLTQLTAWHHFELIALLGLIAGSMNYLIYNNTLLIPALKAYTLLPLAMLLVYYYFYVVGLKHKDISFGQRNKAFLAHYGTVFAMCYSWMFYLLGGKRQFGVTNKRQHEQRPRFDSSLSELIVPTLCLVAAFCAVMYLKLNSLWAIPLILLAAVSASGFMYLWFCFRSYKSKWLRPES